MFQEAICEQQTQCDSFVKGAEMTLIDFLEI